MKQLQAITALLGTGLAIQMAAAASPQFVLRPLVSGYALAADAASVSGEGRCGEGKCGMQMMDTNNDGKVTVGAPTVAAATVTADVVEHIRGEKKLTFKMKRRKGYHKSIGHRQELTVVKIKAINA